MRFYDFLKKEDTRILSSSIFQSMDDQQRYVGTSIRFIIDELPSLKHIDLIFDVNMKQYTETNTFKFHFHVMFVDKIDSFGKDAQFVGLKEYSNENLLFIYKEINKFFKLTKLDQFQKYFQDDEDNLSKIRFLSEHFKDEQFLNFLSDSCLFFLNQHSDVKSLTVFNRNKPLFIEQITNTNRELINLFSELTDTINNSEDFNDFLELHFRY